MSHLVRTFSILSLLSVVAIAALATGCVSISRYGELKQEVRDLRYQHKLEHLYVAGLKVQNRQLQEQKHQLLSELETAGQEAPR
jgi:outer membrane murein-binding lipoprotein Lpp